MIIDRILWGILNLKEDIYKTDDRYPLIVTKKWKKCRKIGA